MTASPRTGQAGSVLARRAALGLLCVAALAVPVRGAPSGSGEPAQRLPNILLFLADDMGIGDVHAYNAASRIPTPNMDRLAAQGMRFTDAHSPSSVCTPTRYAVLTGRYAWRARPTHRLALYFVEPVIEPGRLTLPAMLRRAGYATAAIGKWHLGLNVRRADGSGFARGGSKREPPPEVDFSAPVEGGPLDYGFDYYFGKPGGLVRAFVENRSFVGEPVRTEDGGSFEVPGWEESQKGVIQLAKALAFIDRHHAARPDRPFFLYYASHSPHWPYTPPQRIGDTPVAGRSGVGPRGDLVLENDVVLGRLVARLEALNLARHTVIVLTSDNGPRIGQDAAGSGHDPTAGLRGSKGAIWEAGHRVPFIVHWGDGTREGSSIAPGTTSDALIGLQDLMATTAALVGHSLPRDAAEDSENQLPVLMGRHRGEPARGDLVLQSGSGTFAFRKGTWKLVLGSGRRHSSGRGEERLLFNLARDPFEKNNLSAARPDVVAELEARFAQLRAAGHSASRIAGPKTPVGERDLP